MHTYIKKIFIIYNYILLITITSCTKGKVELQNMLVHNAPLLILLFFDFCCMIIFEAAHLVSCCNKLKLLFSIFTLIEVKEKKLLFD